MTRSAILFVFTGLPGESRHMWDEASYETVAWCGPALGPTVLR
jgi:hypothetical protein